MSFVISRVFWHVIWHVHMTSLGFHLTPILTLNCTSSLTCDFNMLSDPSADISSSTFAHVPSNIPPGTSALHFCLTSVWHMFWKIMWRFDLICSVASSSYMFCWMSYDILIWHVFAHFTRYVMWPCFWHVFRLAYWHVLLTCFLAFHTTCTCISCGVCFEMSSTASPGCSMACHLARPHHVLADNSADISSDIIICQSFWYFSVAFSQKSFHRLHFIWDALGPLAVLSGIFSVMSSDILTWHAFRHFKLQVKEGLHLKERLFEQPVSSFRSWNHHHHPSKIRSHGLKNEV